MPLTVELYAMNRLEKSLRLEQPLTSDTADLLLLLGEESSTPEDIDLELLLKRAEEASSGSDLVQAPEDLPESSENAEIQPTISPVQEGKDGAEELKAESHEADIAVNSLVTYKRDLFQRGLLSKAEELSCCSDLAEASDKLEKIFAEIGIDQTTFKNLKQHMDLQQGDFDDFASQQVPECSNTNTEQSMGLNGQTIRYDINIRLAETILKTASEALQVDARQRTRLERYLGRARKAFDRLVEANLRLVVFVAKKFQNRGIELSDLIQEGNIGLLRAASRFDHKKGFKFSTYAYWWIRQSIQNSLGNCRSLIRYPSSYYQDLVKVHACANRSLQLTGKTMDIDSIAELADMPAAKVARILKLSHRVFSADTPANTDSQATFIDFFEDQSSLSNSKRIEQVDNQKLVNKLTRHLNPRENFVITHRFGIGLSRYYSLQEVSEMLGCTRERIRQIEKTSLKKIREFARKADFGVAIT